MNIRLFKYKGSNLLHRDSCHGPVQTAATMVHCRVQSWRTPHSAPFAAVNSVAIFMLAKTISTRKQKDQITNKCLVYFIVRSQDHVKVQGSCCWECGMLSWLSFTSV